MEYVVYSKNAAKIRNFRNYKKVSNKNKMLKNIVLLILFISILSMFSNIIFAKTKLSSKEISVDRGTTIWNIASKLCKNNESLNVQNVILDIKKLNNLDSSVIYDGQKLLVYEY